MCVDFAGPVLHHMKHKTQSGIKNIRSILFSVTFNTEYVTADIYNIST